MKAQSLDAFQVIADPSRRQMLILLSKNSMTINTLAENFLQPTYDKQFHNGDLASHVIVAIMQRGANPKIPALEEIAATAAAIENILLGATGAGVASFWSTGGMTHKLPMKDFLQLKEEDVVMGIIYFGYSDEKSEGKRATSMEEKTKWY